MGARELLDILAYKRQVLEQFFGVASIFGGFAITGVIALRAEAQRDRVHSLAFGALATAAIAFIFATALDAVWLPISHLSRLRTAPALQAVLDTGDSIAWAVLIGAACLVAAVGLFGFARSRRMGFCILLITTVATVAFLENVLALVRATK